VLLGVYHPRHLLITTPSYTFNARFTPPNITERAGYPDPTGRTKRTFRHHDHKFEWTAEEFRDWCEAAAEEWGYYVAIGTIGMAVEKDPWGREEECGGASQVAEFTRRDGTELAEMRKGKSGALELREAEGTKHELLITHQHTVHASSKRPVTSLREISEYVKLKMEELEDALVRFEELWFDQELSVMCGGWIEILMDATEQDERLILHKKNTVRRDDWQVELVAGVQKKQVLWADKAGLQDRQPVADGSCLDGTLAESVEHENDIEFGHPEVVPAISGSQETSDYTWDEPRSWIYNKLGGWEDVESWGEAWGSKDQSWGSISCGVPAGSVSGRETSTGDL
jgi:hypothetical protein